MREASNKVEAPIASQLDRARTLVLKAGWNTTCYQLVNPGFEMWFAGDGDALVGFVTRNGVRVVAGAPVCRFERLAAVVEEFERDARRNDLQVCYFGAEARLEGVLRESRRHSMVLLGAQPVWAPERWARSLAQRPSVRAQLRRARNKQVDIEEWAAERATRHPALERCLRQWLATRRLPPMHFLIEPETLSRLFDRRVFVARRRAEVVGFLVASPVPTRAGWLIEQVVRGAAAPNGTAELLIDAAMRAFAADGARYVTLGLSPLSQHAAHPRDDARAWLRSLLRFVKAHGTRFYNFGGLDAFKAKLGPHRWEPIYAIAAEPDFGPRMLYSIAAAFTGEPPARFLARAALDAIRQTVGRRTANDG